MNGDQYKQVNAFSTYGTSVVTLEVNPATQDICYLRLLSATVNCVSYSASVPPVVDVRFEFQISRPFSRLVVDRRLGQFRRRPAQRPVLYGWILRCEQQSDRLSHLGLW